VPTGGDQPGGVVDQVLKGRTFPLLRLLWFAWPFLHLHTLPSTPSSKANLDDMQTAEDLLTQTGKYFSVSHVANCSLSTDLQPRDEGGSCKEDVYWISRFCAYAGLRIG
jgi:hypothetical protein